MTPTITARAMISKGPGRGGSSSGPDRARARKVPQPTPRRTRAAGVRMVRTGEDPREVVEDAGELAMAVRVLS
ncbi:hypothetical protein GCM10010977_07130 [Citricoccus zhacaiensis]|uniref:Uncharacterized protein n=1 Tax=Citricoccus zhacaiensis TaxID=489142 RepID=A0ABQ2LR06_9MICC|nr:hypothetical protein GCM10010977_07130 [Citricoccus zhacaiensis]